MKKPKRLFRDRVRMATEPGEVDPGRWYQMEMPDGSCLMMPGTSLLETRGAMAGMVEAIRSGDEASIRAATDRFKADADKDPGVVVYCTRVGAIPDGVLPPNMLAGYRIADCDRCRSPVWLSPHSHAMVERGARPICTVCVPM